MTELIKTIVLQPEITANITGFEVYFMADDPINKIVIASVNLIADTGEKIDRSNIIVWKDEEYDLAGQWTDEDLHNKLIQLL